MPIRLLKLEASQSCTSSPLDGGALKDIVCIAHFKALSAVTVTYLQKGYPHVYSIRHIIQGQTNPHRQIVDPSQNGTNGGR